MEIYGEGHSFYNNEVENHTGSGMQFAGSNPTGHIKISSQNPIDDADTPRYVEGNAAGGIVTLGSEWCTANNATCSEDWWVKGIMLDHVLVRNNAIWGIVLDSASDNGASYMGFVNSSCMSGNDNGNVKPNVSPHLTQDIDHLKENKRFIRISVNPWLDSLCGILLMVNGIDS